MNQFTGKTAVISGGEGDAETLRQKRAGAIDIAFERVAQSPLLQNIGDKL